MDLTCCTSYRELSLKASSLTLDELKQKPELLLCTATGSSPEGLYKNLVREAGIQADLFRQLRILKLDEWGGIPDNHPGSCEHFLRSKLLESLQIPEERYISFASDPPDPIEECKRIKEAIRREGPIDLCILGLGSNGHLGLNEPAEKLEPHCHVATLSLESLQHSMIEGMDPKPSYGLTLGMQEILTARKILMLITGKGKSPVAHEFLSGKISTRLPASFLWLHPDVECLIDESCL